MISERTDNLFRVGAVRTVYAAVPYRTITDFHGLFDQFCIKWKATEAERCASPAPGSGTAPLLPHTNRAPRCQVQAVVRWWARAFARVEPASPPDWGRRGYAPVGPL